MFSYITDYWQQHLSTFLHFYFKYIFGWGEWVFLRLSGINLLNSTDRDVQ